jgi:YebC/PmpR family DNA-binding regulatory protein
VARAALGRRADAVMMGRRFENNKLRMAKSQAQYAKKASYIGKKVVIAVKASGPDPDINRALAAVIREAGALEVGKDVIDRNIKRALEPDTSDYKELTYEAYGYGGVGLIINVLSDNNNRASADVNTAVSKSGCKIANSGSVLFNFAKSGRLCLSKAIDEDQLLELAIEAGCEGDVRIEPPDYDGRGDQPNVQCVVITSAVELGAVQAALQAGGYECSGSLVHIPMAFAEGLTEEDEEANYKCIDRLEELDDVSFVEHNMAPSLEAASA